MRIKNPFAVLITLAAIEMLMLGCYFIPYTQLKELYGHYAWLEVLVLSVAGIAAKMWSGSLLQRISAKNMLLLSNIGVLLAAVGYLVLPRGIWWDSALRIYHGAVWGISLTAVDAATRAVTPKERLGSATALISSSVMVSYMLFGGIVVTLLRGQETLHFVMGAIASFVSVGLTMLMEIPYGPKKSKATQKTDSQASWIVRGAIPFTLIITGVAMFYGSISAYLPSATMPGKALQFIFMMGAVSIVARWIAGWLADKLGEFPVTLIAVGALIGSVFLLLGDYTTAAAFCIGIGFGPISVVLLSATMRKVGSDKGGVASSTFFMGYDTGMLIGQMFGGVLIGNWLWFLLPLGLSLFTTLFSRYSFLREDP